MTGAQRLSAGNCLRASENSHAPAEFPSGADDSPVPPRISETELAVKFLQIGFVSSNLCDIVHPVLCQKNLQEPGVPLFCFSTSLRYTFGKSL